MASRRLRQAAAFRREAVDLVIPCFGLAAGLERDRDAVQTALHLPWTMSPAEGQVNRIKTAKRSMYGRAGFELLHVRVFRAARRRNNSTGNAGKPVFQR